VKILNPEESSLYVWEMLAMLLPSSPYNHETIPGSPPLDNATFNDAVAFFDWFALPYNTPPMMSSSTISAQYLCQVHVQKPWGSLIVSVLVADLVFLQVLWTLLRFIVTWMAERKNEEAKYCLGCAKQIPHEDYESLTTHSPVPAVANSAEMVTIASKAPCTNSYSAEATSESLLMRTIPRKPVGQRLSQDA
jgi:hypothetical protein